MVNRYAGFGFKVAALTEKERTEVISFLRSFYDRCTKLEVTLSFIISQNYPRKRKKREKAKALADYRKAMLGIVAEFEENCLKAGITKRPMKIDLRKNKVALSI